MSQVSILAGIYSDRAAIQRVSYPINLEPMLVDNGLSKGQLVAAGGVTQLATGPGEDRGAIVWNSVCYRVMGTSLVSVSGTTVTVLGDVGGSGPVSMDYSFSLLAITSSGNLFYWDGASVRQVTDPDLGVALDVMWLDGYFMTTDGTSLVVTELNDPFSVDPLKYGSSEEDPDPIVALRKVRGQAYALNRNTIENFQNVGATGFPFSRNPGGLIPKGCVGTKACSDFLEAFAFVGGGRDEAISVYLAGQGQALPMSTPEIDRQLAELTDEQQAAIECESRIEAGEQKLLVHLPDRTLVYSHQASRANESPVWHILRSGILADQQYAARHFVLTGGKWICGSADAQVGYLDPTVESHFGAVAGWRFDTTYLFNGGAGFILKAVELAAQTGISPLGETPTCFLSLTRDGRVWGQERAIGQGAFGESRKRLQWRPKTMFGNFAGLRFRGANLAIASFMRLDVDAEPLRA